MPRIHVCAVLAVAAVAAGPIASGQGRGVPLPVSLTSAEAVARALQSAAANGADTIEVQLPIVTGPGGRDGFDPLDEAIRQARERRLRVHGVVTLGPVTPGGELPPARDHVAYQHPEWLMVPRALAIELAGVDPRDPSYLGRLLRWTRANGAAGLYLSPVHPEATAWLTSALSRTLKRYAIDEVTLDLRVPGDDFDASARALEAFRTVHRPTLTAAERRRLDEIEQIDPFAWSDEFPDEWTRFQRTRRDSLMASLRGVAAVERPATVVHARLSVTSRSAEPGTGSR